MGIAVGIAEAVLGLLFVVSGVKLLLVGPRLAGLANLVIDLWLGKMAARNLLSPKGGVKPR